MIRLFSNKITAFWVLQIGGWLGYGLVRVLNGLANGRTLAYIYPSIAAMLTGFVLTLFLRSVLRSLKDRPLPYIIVVSALLSAVLGLVFSVLETIAHVALYNPFRSFEPLEFLGNAMFDAYVLIAWTGLYFGINYYLLMQEERAKTLAARVLANEAQLKMLQYQLNPHFLFNTLNAVSTLVLEKDTKAANGMLTKLSSFLRHTLVNHPAHKVTLEDELSALRLYLEIEQVRFEERLKIDWQIDDDARRAMLPNLLLQPIIENAIKYAIAPSESGGTIGIAASVENGALCVRVIDDGPGLPKNPPSKPDKTSSGVGIANTRQRLLQIYGPEHEFRLSNRDPKGLEVYIQIPFEVAETPKPKDTDDDQD